MEHLSLTLLGVPTVLLDGELIYIRRRKALALLIYLAVSQTKHSRGELAALFWPEQAEVSARNNLRRALYSLGADLFRDRVLIGWADDGDDDAWAAAWRAGGEWRRPVFPLKGTDAIARGIPKGPAVGQALSRVEAWWIGEDFRPDRAACLVRLADEA